MSEAKMKTPRQNMPVQEANQRICNFSEVALGLTEEQALLEASRCINCKKPGCVEGCPVDVDIPAFIKLVKEQKYQEAINKIKEKNNLPAICGRVCPQENQCEKLCVIGKKNKPVAIGNLERFVADWQMRQGEVRLSKMPDTGKQVAVVGAGPAGLTAAADLAKLGHQVAVMEALHTPGGVLVYGIPEFRLPKTIVEKEIDSIKELGVEIRNNMVVGKINSVDELLESGFDAVFVGTGAGLPYFMNIPGENLNGVYSANEFLTRTNLMKGYLFPNYTTPVKVGERVAVIGAGNVAMDSARTALRLGAREAYIVYRRSDKEMPARHEEIEHAKEEGVQFALLTSPLKILGDADGWVSGMICQQYELGEPDASGRRSPVPIKGATYKMDIDTVVMAIGQGPNPLVPSTTPDLTVNHHGNIVADLTNGKTSKVGIFAGGDIVTGAATVIQAMGAGKKAAAAIHEYLTSNAAW